MSKKQSPTVNCKYLIQNDAENLESWRMSKNKQGKYLHLLSPKKERKIKQINVILATMKRSWYRVQVFLQQQKEIKIKKLGERKL